MAYLFDTFTNFLSGLGVAGRDKMTAHRYVHPIWTREQLEAAYQSDWIARKAIVIPAQDSVREWRAWQAEAKQIELLEATEKRLLIQQKLQEALIKSRLYGGACMLIGVDGNMAEELDPEKIKKDGLKFVHVFAPHQLAPQEITKDISSPYYGQPSFYKLNDTKGLFGDVSIHPSRMVRLIGLDPPDPMANFGWGDPMMHVIHDAVSSAGTVLQSVATMISEAKIDVIKIPGLTEIFATTDGTQRMIKRFTEANIAKSVVNSILIDGEEDWQRIQVQFRGMPEVLQMYIQVAAGAADIPVTRFVGQSPAGLNSTGDGDLQNYYNRIGADQALRLTPALEKLDKAITRSALGTSDPNVFYIWNSLWEMSDQEKSAIALSKAQATALDVNSGLVPFDALSKGKVNQLIEDGTYPGLEAAMEESAIDEEMMAEQTLKKHEQALLPPPSGMGGQVEEDEEEFAEDSVDEEDDTARRLRRAIHFMNDALRAWNEEAHSRGQPENAGQFGPGGYGAKAKEGKGRVARARARGKGARAKAKAHIEERAEKGGSKRASKGKAARIPASERVAKAATFVSPNIRSDLDLSGAEKQLDSKQQKLLLRTSKGINKRLDLDDAEDVSMIGAWKDGAENSIMTVSDGDYDKVALAAVMKAHIADQKAVLVFAEGDEGDSTLASFKATGDLKSIHENLLQDGVVNHTLVPTEGGARVYVVDLDGSASDAIKLGAMRYGGESNEIRLQHGKGEFIGTDKEDGTDREQRDSAREVYEAFIERSPVRGSDQIWKEVHDAWSASNAALGQKVRNVIEGPQDKDPDPMGRWVQLGGKIDTDAVEKQTRANVTKAAAAAKAAGTTPLPGSKAEHPATIASAPITVKGSTPSYRRPEVAGMKLDPERYAHDIGLFSNEDFYPNFGPNELQGDTDQQTTAIVAQMKDNLKWLYKFADPHTQVWYDGARALVDDRVKIFGFNDASVAGVYAALSPTKKWDENVQIADALMDIYKNKQDHAWDDKMTETADDIWSGGTKVAKKNQAVVKSISGKKLGELTDPTEKAIWIRTYDEAHNSQAYRDVLPNGALGKFARNQDEFGTPAHIVWQSVASVKSAVMALEANGDREKIDAAFGNAHKVRSFYNNILDPHSENGDVTIDTHAVGAALLRQLSNKTVPVAHNFGNTPEKKNQPVGWDAAGSSIKTGLSGLYPVYATAYHEAAKELGIQPRQLQSAVWVVKRETFGNMSDKARADSEQAWHDYHDGKATLDETRERIAKLAGLKRK